MVQRNLHLAKLTAGYLFPEISKRVQALKKRAPDAKIISLGIGDTTYPLDECVTNSLEVYVKGLSTWEGYSGYGPEQGQWALREKIAQWYGNIVTPDEIFVSDGAKCDIGRLQLLFGPNTRIAVQDPTYPVYVDTSIMTGKEGIIYMPCTPENDFFPDLTKLERPHLIYFCSPNNPTGSVATRQQLQELVAYAKKNRAIIIFDSAYACYIQDSSLPRSIYEIEGAREVAIEVNSFSKMAGFTGVRLGWTIVPKELCFDDGYSVRKDWERIHTTCFNGASNIAQRAGIAVLEHPNVITSMVSTYRENARIIREGCEQLELSVYGGIHAPYVWVKFPQKSSWDIFEELLEEAHVVTTPGSGFGTAGEGFLRLSAFGRREQVVEAMACVKTFFLAVKT